MKTLTIVALLAGAMMFTWAVAAAGPVYAAGPEYETIEEIPGESTDDAHSSWNVVPKTLPKEPGIGTSPEKIK